MKKKYVAVMLGLVLSMSTASVYAAGSTASTAADSSSSDNSDTSSDNSENQMEMTVSRLQNRTEIMGKHQRVRNRTENRRRVTDREAREEHRADSLRELTATMQPMIIQKIQR